MTATDDYLRSRAAESGPSATVLDLGCGDGRFVEMLLDQGLNAIGIDVAEARPTIEARAARRLDLNLTGRICYFTDPEPIPLPDNSGDVILSNTVFEHIITLNSTVGELARILRLDGKVYTVFPLASAVIEQHSGLPWIRRLQSSRLRLMYLNAARTIGLRRGEQRGMERNLYKDVFYRYENDMWSLFRLCFDGVESDVAEYVRIKADSLIRRGGYERCWGASSGPMRCCWPGGSMSTIPRPIACRLRASPSQSRAAAHAGCATGSPATVPGPRPARRASMPWHAP
jgi:SAM-dependent methyltransferase